MTGKSSRASGDAKKKLTLLIKKPKPQISPFTKNLTFGNNRDPWGGGVKGCLAFSQNSSTFWVMSVPYLNVFWLNSCSPQPLSFDVNDLTDKIKRNGGAPTAPPSAHIPRLGFSSLLSSPTHIWPEHTHSDKTWLTYLCTSKYQWAIQEHSKYQWAIHEHSKYQLGVSKYQWAIQEHSKYQRAIHEHSKYQ